MPRRSELVEIIRDLRQRGIAIVWIEHIVHLLLQVTDRLICMDAGRVIADGEPKAVMADQAVIDAYLGRERVSNILAVEQLDVRHGLLQAVREVSFSVAKGEVVAFVGANGAGKTTLFRAIAGAHLPIGGRILFEGSDVTALPDHRARPARHRAGARRTAPVHADERTGKSATRRCGRPARAVGTSTLCSRSFPISPAASTPRPATCRAASSRRRPSAGR